MNLPSSSWELPQTGHQAQAITRLCIALQQREELEHGPRTRGEARTLIYQLRGQLKAKRRCQ